MALTTKDYLKHGSWLKSEPLYIQPITIDTSVTTVLASGTVLGKLTAGQYAAYNDSLSDGTQTAVGILLEAATGGDDAAMVTAFVHVTEAGLTGIDANGKTDLSKIKFE